MPRKADSNDFFADIAAQKTEYLRPGLMEPEPPELPDVVLPCRTGGDTTMPGEADRLTTAEGLRKELERYRRRFAPFMANHAPPLNTSRSVLPLERFDWRVQAEEDLQDFTSVLAGHGAWEEVIIPHYGPPLGLATTYYRTSFTVTREQLDTGAAFVCFKGVDYKAHVFVNGTYLGSHEGFFAPFEFDFTACAREGANVLVVRVENDATGSGSGALDRGYSGDKIYAATGPGFDEPEVGWHHCPPGMGIYQPVQVEFRPSLFVSDLYVRPLPEQKAAELWVEVFLCDAATEDVAIRYGVHGRNFEETLFEDRVYRPGGMHRCGFGDDLQIAKAKADGTYGKEQGWPMGKGVNYLRIPIPMETFRRWTPDEPWLYQVQVTLEKADGQVVDRAEQHFGMRSFLMDEAGDPKGSLYLNGQPIRLRGANTMGHEQQCVMKGDLDQLRDDLLLARICNMNFLRFTQRPVQDEVYTMCDMLGLMAQVDLPTFGAIRRNQYCEILRQVDEMEKLARPHPSCIMVSYINEPSPEGGNSPHRNLGREELDGLFQAADAIVRHRNPERVIKPCDGDYDPPSPGIPDRHCYMGWYNGQGVDYGRLHKGFWQPTKTGWLYGCGEFGAEGLERAELMRKAYPAAWLPRSGEEEAAWSPSRIKLAQSGRFHHFFFDTPDSVDDWVEASQAYQAECVKMMAEAFRRDNRMVTFAVHLFIDAFPSGWMKAIMDCERHPKEAYFAYRDALAPLLPSLRTDRRRVYGGEPVQVEAWLCNDLPDTPKGLRLRYGVQFAPEAGEEPLGASGVLAAGEAAAKIDPCGARFQGLLAVQTPEVKTRCTAVVRLALVDELGQTLNSTDLEIEVFPDTRDQAAGEVVILGADDGPATRLAAEMKSSVVASGAPVYLVDDFDAFVKREEEIVGAVRDGARVVFLSLPDGTYPLGERSFRVKTSDFNPLHFVSRKTGHDLVKGFEARDFSHWYDPVEDRIRSIIEATLTGDDFIPILKAGNTNDEGQWTAVLAAGEQRHGKGAFIVCQVELAGRTSSNPPAHAFAARLLGG